MEIFENRILWTSFIATLAAQIVKVLLVMLSEQRWAPDRFVETGGMPSSHSAAVSALATSMGMTYGWTSPYFTISMVFGSIVMYDATGIRRAAGKQAELINELVLELTDLFDEGFKPQALKTLLGHTYPQVLGGAALGVLVGVISMVTR